MRAGPRKNLFFKPKNVKAVILQVGGLCPGINVVIRELYMCLTKNYKVDNVYGVKYGFKGLEHLEKFTDDMVMGIHKKGGSFLGCKREEVDSNIVIDLLKK